MNVASVTVGRNQGLEQTPMNDYLWELLRSEVLELFQEVYFQGQSVGTWQGKQEVNFHVHGVLNVKSVEEHLSNMADFFRQESIALSQGTSKLVKPISWQEWLELEEVEADKKEGQL